jgi:hypothetical protein
VGRAAVALARRVALGALVLLVACSGGSGASWRGTRAAASAFVAAWQRSRLGTWAEVLQFDRRLPDGKHLRYEIRQAQRPPDRLRVGGGTVDARRGDQLLACATGQQEQLVCRDAGAAPDYRVEVDREVAILRDEVLAATPVYAVRARGAGCFDLRLLRTELLVQPYGLRARFCFDAATGAPTRQEVRRKTGVDVQTALVVRGQVTAADLAPPPTA